MKSIARVLLNGTYDEVESKVNVLNSSYDARLVKRVSELVYAERLDLSISNTLILVPHTLPLNNEKRYSNVEEQEPYLRFTVIGVVKNQPDKELNNVNIIGKVIYENVQHQFVLVKIEREDGYEIIKLNGLLDESLQNGKGRAVEKLYNISAEVDKKSLYIVSSSQINQKANFIPKQHYGKVIDFPNTSRYDAA